MADNTTLNPGALGDTIATLEVLGVKHEKVIVEYLVGGVPTMVDATNKFPVTDAISEAALASIASEDFATQATLAAILAKIIAAPSTEAKQDTGNTSLATIAAKDFATQTTLAAILAKIIAAPATETKQDTGNTSLATIAAKDFATQTTLAAILAKIIAAPATEAKQDTQITALGTLAAAPTTIFNNKTTVTTAGTRVVLAASQAVKSVTIKALSTNTGFIYVGNATVASTNGFQLSAGDTVSMDIANLNTVNIDSSVNAEGVTYISVN